MPPSIQPIPLGKDAPLDAIAEHDSEALGFNCWDPTEYAKRGWVRAWGDAAMMSEYFEVLRKEEKGRVHFLVLCPTFLRRPLKFTYSMRGEASY